MAGTFTLTLTMPTYAGSNAAHSEACDVARLLNQAANDVASGRPTRQISHPNPANGLVCTYTYGAGMANAGR
jgi:hypothetical protein